MFFHQSSSSCSNLMLKGRNRSFIKFYQTRPSLILEFSEKFPVDMNSGEFGRSEGLAPATGGPFGWLRKLASGVIPPKSLTIGIEPEWSIGAALKNKTLINFILNMSKKLFCTWRIERHARWWMSREEWRLVRMERRPTVAEIKFITSKIRKSWFVETAGWKVHREASHLPWSPEKWTSSHARELL